LARASMFSCCSSRDYISGTLPYRSRSSGGSSFASKSSRCFLPVTPLRALSSLSVYCFSTSAIFAFASFSSAPLTALVPLFLTLPLPSGKESLERWTWPSAFHTLECNFEKAPLRPVIVGVQGGRDRATEACRILWQEYVHRRRSPC
jgi:hypothetical protein